MATATASATSITTTTTASPSALVTPTLPIPTIIRPPLPIIPTSLLTTLVLVRIPLERRIALPIKGRHERGIALARTALSRDEGSALDGAGESALVLGRSDLETAGVASAVAALETTLVTSAVAALVAAAVSTGAPASAGAGEDVEGVFDFGVGVVLAGL